MLQAAAARSAAVTVPVAAASVPRLPRLPARALFTASTIYPVAGAMPRLGRMAQCRGTPATATGHAARAAAPAVHARHQRQPQPAGSQPAPLLCRRQLGSRRGSRQRRPPQRAADMVRGLAAGADEGDDTGALHVEAAAAAWWHRLSSPYDREIFLLAIPALFRWAGRGAEQRGPGAGVQRGCKPALQASRPSAVRCSSSWDAGCLHSSAASTACQPRQQNAPFLSFSALHCSCLPHAGLWPALHLAYMLPACLLTLFVPACRAQCFPSPSCPLPACGSVLLDPIMGMVSTAVIGSKLGTAPLAAVGLVTICFNFSK